MEPTIIGPFEIIGNLGSGPRGTVYRARHTSHGRIVAIKQLAATLPPDSPEFTRLWNEVARLRAVVSNHVATTHSVEILDGRPLIEMESLGESLEKVTIGRALPLHDATRAIHDVLAGLKVLHDAGIIHDNLKPSNVLQDTTTGSWKLSDGGTTAIEAQTSPTLLATSVLYVAPETLLRHSQPSERSDLYCVGMMSLEAVLGSDGLREAFPQVPNISSPSRWLAWLEDPAKEAVPLRELRPETPEAISKFVSKLVSKDPAARFPSAFAATVELEAILEMLAGRTDAVTQMAPGDAPTMFAVTERQAEPTAWLVVTGPEGHDQRIDLSDRTYRIGRDPQNDIVLPDDTKTVSRIHAELRRERDRYTLNDLDSQNGLMVNGRRKPSVQLQPGVPVKIGVYTLTFLTPAVAAESTARLAKPATATPASARSAAATPAAPSAAMARVKAVADSVRDIVLAWWPPKNASEWGAVLAVPIAVFAIITWFALRGSPPPPPAPADVVAVNPGPVTPPPSAHVPGPREQSLAQIRQALDRKDYDSAGRDIENLLLLNPQDAEALKLKEEALAGAAPPEATATTTPKQTPAGKGTQNKPTTSARSRGASGADATTTSTGVVPTSPTDAEKLEMARGDRNFRRALQVLEEIQRSSPGYPGLSRAAAQVGSAAEGANDRDSASRLFKFVHDVAPTSAEAQSLTAQGLVALKEAKEDATDDMLKSRAAEGYEKAIRHLPDGHPGKKEAQDRLRKLRGGLAVV